MSDMASKIVHLIIMFASNIDQLLGQCTADNCPKGVSLIWEERCNDYV